MEIVATEVTQACLHCGAGLSPTNQRGRLYCSERCRKNAERSRNRRRRRAGQSPPVPVPASRCMNCGGAMPPMRLRYCSEVCRERFRRGPSALATPVACQRCGELFRRNNTAARYCSIECRPSYKPPKTSRTRTRECLYCGASLLREPRRLYCSRSCQGRAERERWKQRMGLPPRPRSTQCVICDKPLSAGQRHFQNTCSYRCELDRINRRCAELRSEEPGWRERERARRMQRRQERSVIFRAVRELGWLDEEQSVSKPKRYLPRGDPEKRKLRRQRMNAAKRQRRLIARAARELGLLDAVRDHIAPSVPSKTEACSPNGSMTWSAPVREVT